MNSRGSGVIRCPAASPASNERQTRRLTSSSVSEAAADTRANGEATTSASSAALPNAATPRMNVSPDEPDDPAGRSRKYASTGR